MLPPRIAGPKNKAKDNKTKSRKPVEDKPEDLLKPLTTGQRKKVPALKKKVQTLARRVGNLGELADSLTNKAPPALVHKLATWLARCQGLTAQLELVEGEGWKGEFEKIVEEVNSAAESFKEFFPTADAAIKAAQALNNFDCS